MRPYPIKVSADQLYLSSDPHYYHKNILKYTKRPFVDITTMNAGLVERWNSVVPPDGIAFLLGDLGFADPSKVAPIISGLNGRKYWCPGNHDTKMLADRDFCNLFEAVQHIFEIVVEEADGAKQFIVASHFPLLVWNHSHRGSWHVHGHCHGTLIDTNDPRIDVGVDTNDCYPYTYAQLKAKMVGRVYSNPDRLGREGD